MKTKQGQKYDGWTIKRRDGTIDPYYFDRTRTEVIDQFRFPAEGRQQTRARLRRWGFTIVKVRLVLAEQEEESG